MSRDLWEILVPVYKNGRPYDGEFSIAYHQEWDSQVREISGGLTILKPVTGEWSKASRSSVEDPIVREPMIPVRFMGNRRQAEQIAILTKHWYDQKSVMCYKLSNEVIFI